MKKKLLPMLLVCCLLAVWLAVGTTAADDIVASGDCGESVKWTLDNKGTLTISGRGAMYNSWSPPLWYNAHSESGNRHSARS